MGSVQLLPDFHTSQPTQIHILSCSLIRKQTASKNKIKLKKTRIEQNKKEQQTNFSFVNGY